MSQDTFVSEFLAGLRARAELLSSHGAAEAASTCRYIAHELDVEFRRWWLAELTVAEASTESGYSADRLRELVREGRLPDRRSPELEAQIRIRRADLPRRPGVPRPVDAVEELAGKVLARRR